MRVALRNIGDVLTSTHLQLVLVQLRSPFAGSEPELRYQRVRRTYSWEDTEYIDQRISKIRQILTNLAELGPQPSVVVFPEYAVPQQALAYLHDYSESTHSLIIGGSYYEDDQSMPGFRNNICTIFVPGQNPLKIVKLNGFRQEALALDVKKTLPNIARLTWNTADNKKKSINIFLCRDYLIPYSHRSRGGKGEIKEHISKLDWDNEGLNVVIMNSPESELFEAQAAFDLRRMRGPGKVVALCNCSETASSRGSALLGPSETRREGDLVDYLPPDKEGIIVADLELNNVAVVEIKPDTKVNRPIQAVQTYSIISSEGMTGLLLEPARQRMTASERGVWHPAFLDVIGRELHVDLYATGSLDAVRSAFAQNRINYVYAGIIRGEQDVMIRRYAMRNESSAGEPLAHHPYSSLGSRFDVLFERHTRIVIRPIDFLKFRTKKINQEDWNRRVTETNRLLRHLNEDRRNKRLEAISRLTADWNDPRVDLPERQVLAPVFLDEREATLPMRPGEPNERRETWVLIAPLTGQETDLDRFEREVVEGILLQQDEIRSVFRIAVPPWKYLLHIIAPPRRTDDILLELSSQARGLDVGTRAFDVMLVLKAEAASSLAVTDLSQEVSRFVSMISDYYGTELAEFLDQRRIAAHGELLTEVAKTWFHQASIPDGAFDHPAVREVFGGDGLDYINRFYGFLYLFNLVPNDHREIYRKEAVGAWSTLYRALEELSRTTVEKCLGKAGAELDEALEERYSETAEQWRYIRSDRFIVALFVIGDMLNVKTRDFRLSYQEHVRKFRNDVIHEVTRSREMFELGSEGWRDKFEIVRGNTEHLIRLIKATTGWLAQV